jgi:hypothetical protein
MGGISKMVERALAPKLQQIDKNFINNLEEIEDHAKNEVIDRINKFEKEMRDYKVTLVEEILNKVMQRLKDEKNN